MTDQIDSGIPGVIVGSDREYLSPAEFRAALAWGSPSQDVRRIPHPEPENSPGIPPAATLLAAYLCRPGQDDPTEIVEWIANYPDPAELCLGLLGVANDVLLTTMKPGQEVNALADVVSCWASGGDGSRPLYPVVRA